MWKITENYIFLLIVLTRKKESFLLLSEFVDDLKMKYLLKWPDISMIRARLLSLIFLKNEAVLYCIQFAKVRKYDKL